MTDFADGFLDAYLAECDEHLATVRQALLVFEDSVGKAKPDRRLTEELFRSFHSLKGLAGMVEDRDAELLAHEMEGYLRGVRDGDVRLSTLGHRIADCRRCGSRTDGGRQADTFRPARPEPHAQPPPRLGRPTRRGNDECSGGRSRRAVLGLGMPVRTVADAHRARRQR